MFGRLRLYPSLGKTRGYYLLGMEIPTARPRPVPTKQFASGRAHFNRVFQKGPTPITAWKTKTPMMIHKKSGRKTPGVLLISIYFKARADEARKLRAEGKDPVLKGLRWCWLKRLENLTGHQEATLADLVRLNLKTVKSYSLKEDFQNFWEYTCPAAAAKFLDQWCYRTMRSKNEPMKKVARMLRTHRELLLNCFHAKGEISAGIVEGLHNKVKVTTRKAYGFRSYKIIRIALFHNPGCLPEPEVTHRFCG